MTTAPLTVPVEVGGIMIGELRALPVHLRSAWGHASHHPALHEAGQDGSCATCDFPFGDMPHMCLGSGRQLVN